MPTESRELSLLQNVANGTGAHTSSYLVVTRALSPGEKRPGRDADLSPLRCVEVESDSTLKGNFCFLFNILFLVPVLKSNKLCVKVGCLLIYCVFVRHY